MALIMAGGKGTRMGMDIEKPMLAVGGSSMLECAVDAVRHSKYVDRVIVAVSDKTPLTAEKAISLGVEVITTACNGFEEDMRFAIKILKAGEVLVTSADLPFLTGEVVDRVVEEFRRNRKPALATVIPEATLERLGFKSAYIFDVGRRLAPIGLNMIDGQRIDEPQLEESLLILESEDLAVNVNTPDELEVARRRGRVGRVNSDEQETHSG